MPTLDLNPEIVCQIIDKARAFQAKEDVTFPETPPQPSDDYDFLQVLADHYDDETYLEAVTVIDQLEPDQQMSLVALMYLGRGDYDLSEWDQALEMARENWTARTGEYLLSRPMVADFLEDGLELFGYSCEE